MHVNIYSILFTFQGPNPVANEFIPKSATLTHSASSPNFSTLNGNGFLPPMTSAGPPTSHMMPPEPMSNAQGVGGPPTSMMMSQATMSNTPPPHLAQTSKCLTIPSIHFYAPG